MDLVHLVAQNLGLLVFTAVTAVLFAYLFYALLNPARF
jgi:K+-transporting ATPase KdpF subunit